MPKEKTTKSPKETSNLFRAIIAASVKNPPRKKHAADMPTKSL